MNAEIVGSITTRREWKWTMRLSDGRTYTVSFNTEPDEDEWSILWLTPAPEDRLVVECEALAQAQDVSGCHGGMAALAEVAARP